MMFETLGLHVVFRDLVALVQLGYVGLLVSHKLEHGPRHYIPHIYYAAGVCS